MTLSRISIQIGMAKPSSGENSQRTCFVPPPLERDCCQRLCETENPHRHPKTPMGAFMLSPLRGCCTWIENGAARGSFPAHCAYLMRGFRDRGGFRGTAPRVLALSPRNEARRLQ